MLVDLIRYIGIVIITVVVIVMCGATIKYIKP